MAAARKEGEKIHPETKYNKRNEYAPKEQLESTGYSKIQPTTGYKEENEIPLRKQWYNYNDGAAAEMV